VPAGDPEALAAALAELLALAPEERAAIGARGREHVRERADVARETSRLAALIEQAS
jgi:glycosyltransferase involved in cell wall biosynthesis